MATIQRKSTNQEVHQFQAFWDIKNFANMYPKPSSKAPSTDAPPRSDPIPQLRSPIFKFKTDSKKTRVEAEFKLFAKRVNEDSQDYNLSLDTIVDLKYKVWNLARQPWAVKVQIDLLNELGEVVATPDSGVPRPFDWVRPAPFFGPAHPVSPANHCLVDSLAALWDKQKQYFADDTLHVRLTLTLYGNIIHADEGQEDKSIMNMTIEKKDAINGSNKKKEIEANE
jgi:hypothetical protein